MDLNWNVEVSMGNISESCCCVRPGGLVLGWSKKV